MKARLKLNEIRSVIKMGGILTKGRGLEGWPRKYKNEMFYNRSGKQKVFTKI
jgi:hypothetical protein